MCFVCNGAFDVKPSHFAKRHCCSRFCYAEYQRIAGRGSLNPNWRGGKKYLSCRYCKKRYGVIPARAKTSRYCSRLCQNTFQARMPKVRKQKSSTRVIRIREWVHLRFWKLYIHKRRCQTCGKTPPKGRKYCFLCTPKGKRKIVPCVSCGKSMILFLSEVGKKTTCSLRCANRQKTVRQLGEQSHRYVDGRTPMKRIIRNMNMMQEWRKFVFERDNYTCRRCGQRGGKLTAHHVIPFAKIVRDENITSIIGAMRCGVLWDTSNGMTLCKVCHRIVHMKAA